MTDLKNIDKQWTLFLDRDGVINFEKKNEYVLAWDEFKFMPGVKEALKIVNAYSIIIEYQETKNGILAALRIEKITKIC